MEGNAIAMMVGKTIVWASAVEKGAEAFLFVMNDGSVCGFYHERDCCESVAVEDVCGDMADVFGMPITLAEEVSSEQDEEPKPNEGAESWTWTFYKFSTVRGSVTIRWLGESNGYYSESVTAKVFASIAEVPIDLLAAAPIVVLSPGQP